MSNIQHQLAEEKAKIIEKLYNKYYERIKQYSKLYRTFSAFKKDHDNVALLAELYDDFIASTRSEQPVQVVKAEELVAIAKWIQKEGLIYSAFDNKWHFEADALQLASMDEGETWSDGTRDLDLYTDDQILERFKVKAAITEALHLREESLEPEVQPNDKAAVASHSCTVGNSIEHELRDQLNEACDRINDCRHYLMGTENVTVEDALVALGYDKNGFRPLN